MANFTFTLELDEGAHLLGIRKLRIDGVQLQEVDAIEAQAFEAYFHRSAQMLWAAIGLPASRTGAYQTGLRGNNEIFGIGIQRLGDDALRDFGTI